MGFFNRWKTKKDELAERTSGSILKAARESKKEETTGIKEEKLKRKENIIANVKTAKAKDAYKILIRPWVTEKTTHLQSVGVYCFEVKVDTNKNEIKKAVEGIYGVKVAGVRIITLLGKKVRFGKIQGNRKNRKKAIVTLVKGQSIELYKNV